MLPIVSFFKTYSGISSAAVKLVNFDGQTVVVIVDQSKSFNLRPGFDADVQLFCNLNC